MSQRELSEKSGVPQTTISHIERGETDARLSDFLALVEAAGGDLEGALGIQGERSAAAVEAAAIVLQITDPARQRLALAILRTMRDER